MEPCLVFLNDPRVTNTVTMTAADINDWKKWRSQILRKASAGLSCRRVHLPAVTVDTYLETNVRCNGNPIFRQATGLEVTMAMRTRMDGSSDVTSAWLSRTSFADFDEASAGDVIGLFWQPGGVCNQRKLRIHHAPLLR